MKTFLIAMFLSLSAFAATVFVVGGKAMSKDVVKKVFSVDYQHYVGIDTPPIPIGPSVMITCGHCVPNPAPDNFILHPKMKAGSDDTNSRYDAAAPGAHGLDFLKTASYPYDIALEISEYTASGPIATIASERVKMGENVIVLGMGYNISSQDKLCNGMTNQYAYNTFNVIDFYTQNVGFIVTAKGKGSSATDAATCFGDSGGYYFRTLVDRTVQLVGINSWGTENGIQEHRSDGEHDFAGFYSGAVDLTSPEIHQWLTDVAQKQNLKICGITMSCAAIQSPF
jgi:hypothetical protein